MNTSETLVKYFGLTYNVIKRQTDDLTHEESLIQPPVRGNCINWVLGHILANREPVLKFLGASLGWTAEEVNTYKRESYPITTPEQALPLSRLLSDLDTSQESIITALQQMPAQALEARINDSSAGERIAFSHWHETYHVGQLELLRQLAGKNDKVI